jgi:hypothetical protein
MTEDEKARSGLFWHLKPDVTASVALSLMGDELKELMPFRNQAFAPIPTPIANSAPFSQGGIKPIENDEDEHEDIT